MDSRNTPARSRRLAGLALAASISLAGCAATKPPSDLDPRMAAASEAFEGRYDYLYVPSEGRLADQAFVTSSRVAGPSRLARDLATLMAPAETRVVRVLVTGQSGAKTLQVILDALSFYRGGRLPYLELLYLGDPSHEARLAAELAAIGAGFRFAPYPN